MRAFFICILLCCIALPVSTQAQDTITTASGLKYVITKKGTGRKAQQGEFIIAHYTGTFTDGSVFDSSRERDEPFVFQLGKRQVIPGWDEAFALLNVGDRATLILPPELAYGLRGSGDIPPQSTLIFDVELVDVKTETLASVIAAELEKNGREQAMQKFRELKQNKYGDVHVYEGDMNNLGYRCLKEGKTDDAITVFQMYVEAFPDSFNAYDSLGEAYKEAGNKELSIRNYKHSLKLNPDNENAVIMLKELEKKD